MKIAYFDCFAGISGDMILGALVHAGLEPELLRQEIDKLGLQGVDITFGAVRRQGIAGTRAEVHVPGGVLPEDEHHLDPESVQDGRRHPAHTHLSDILRIIEHSDLDKDTRGRAVRIYQRLAEAEAQVHGVSVDDVGLHEVGAWDAIVDIVGAVAGLRLLGVDKVYASPLRCGTGILTCAHGQYPVPAPAVAALCRDVPVVQTDIAAELITPTGAAVITELAASFGPAPPFRQQQVGYGAGRRDLAELPNLLRVRMGQTSQHRERDEAVLVEANIDDMNPEVYGYLFELLLARGACDVFTTPVHMKKGRPGNLLSVLVDESQLDAIIDTVLAETTTIGLRFHHVERRKLERSSVLVRTEYGEVRVKACLFDERRRLAPEFDDCARLARENDVPILSVYDAAAAQAAVQER